MCNNEARNIIKKDLRGNCDVQDVRHASDCFRLLTAAKADNSLSEWRAVHVHSLMFLSFRPPSVMEQAGLKNVASLSEISGVRKGRSLSRSTQILLFL